MKLDKLARTEIKVVRTGQSEQKIGAEKYHINERQDHLDQKRSITT